MLTQLERSAIDLLVELEAAVATGYALPAGAINGLSRLRSALQSEEQQELARIYRFVKLSQENNLVVSGQDARPVLTLIQPGNKTQTQE